EDWSNALNEFQYSILRNPSAPSIHYLTAMCYEKVGKLKEAKAEYKNVLVLDRDNVKAKKALEYLQSISKKTETAETQYNVVFKPIHIYLIDLAERRVIDPKVVDYSESKAVRYFVQKERGIYSNAEDRNSIETNQKMFELYMAASEMLSSNRTIQSRRTRFAMKLGRQYEEEKNFKKAIECYEQIHNPDKTIKLHIIDLKAKSGDVDEALKEYKKLQQK
ncbi:hypothetical protein KY342_05995, partial [Candidatus Woesearchaeota archaeon]|nr:hypothetical protein [Candidatus Woesearchaeota archaeon]